MTIEVKLPELGDGIESGDVLEVLVQEGDTIAEEQGIVELETDKATVEVPCSHAGRIVKVHVQIGDTVAIGGTLITIEAATPSESLPQPETPSPTAAQPVVRPDEDIQSPSRCCRLWCSDRQAHHSGLRGSTRAGLPQPAPSFHANSCVAPVIPSHRLLPGSAHV